MRAIVARLRAEYPDARTSLTFHTPLELLVATVLSAQSTDVRVNQVTPGLFAKYATAQAYVDAPLDALEQDIKPLGFYRTKAEYLHGTAQQLVDRFGGEVPRTMEELTSCQGSGGRRPTWCSATRTASWRVSWWTRTSPGSRDASA